MPDEPQKGPQEPGQVKPGVVEGPPQLVFVPDKERSAGVARFRRWSMAVVLVVLLVALVLLITWRVNPVPISAGTGTHSPVTADAPASESLAAYPRVPPPGPRSTTSAEMAAAAARAVESAASRAAALWQLMVPFLHAEVYDESAAAAALPGVRQAVALADSALLIVAAATTRLPSFIAAQSQSGTARARYGNLYAAEAAYLKALGSEAGFRKNHVETLERSMDLMLAGDTDEAEVQANVATSYGRKAEIAGRDAKERLAAVREALQSIGIH